MKKGIAVLVIDAQLGLITGSRGPVYQSENLVVTMKKVLQDVRGQEIPVIYIQDDDVATPFSSEWAIHPDIQPKSEDSIIRKKSTDAFVGTNLYAELEKIEANTIIVMGCKTEYCVDSTCRSATSLGLNVLLISDAHSTTDNKVLLAEQIIAHHNCNLHGLDNLENYIEVITSKELFRRLSEKEL